MAATNNKYLRGAHPPPPVLFSNARSFSCFVLMRTRELQNWNLAEKRHSTVTVMVVSADRLAQRNPQPDFSICDLTIAIPPRSLAWLARRCDCNIEYQVGWFMGSFGIGAPHRNTPTHRHAGLLAYCSSCSALPPPPPRAPPRLPFTRRRPHPRPRQPRLRRPRPRRRRPRPRGR